DEEAVAVVLDRAAVVIESEDGLCGVALGQEILFEDIGDVDALRAQVEAVEAGVRVFLKLREVGGVKLILVVAEAAEETRAEIIVAVEKTARVGDEGLDAGAYGEEVEVRVHVFELHFGEGFFE